MDFNIQKYEMALPIGSLESYIHWANQIPILSEAEEKELTNRFYYHQDLEAARRLVMSHLRFVIRVARSYSGYGLPQADLIQEGNIGLMKAIKRFDPKVGVRLVSFAVHWIKAEIHEFILRNWRIVKVATTKAQRKLFFNLRKATKKLNWFSKEEIKDVANALNVSPREVQQMESRLSAYDETFDGYTDEEDNNYNTPANYLEDRRYDPAYLLERQDWGQQQGSQLKNALTTLDERSQDILQQRWLADKKATLHDLAAKYNISAERVRQIETNAMKKLRVWLLDR